MADIDTDRTSTDRGPLSGFKIIDLTENMAGPLATMILGDQGADVIKIESLVGDQVRRLGSGSPGLTAYFANLNRSKRSVALNLADEAGRAVLDRLLVDADVVIQAFRPAAAEKLRIDEPSIRTADRQDLVYCEIVGFGKTGPLAGRAVYDHVVQAMSGIAALQTDANGAPQLIRHGVVDKATGITAAQAITAALLRRSRTGVGESIAVTMLDVALGFLWPDGMMGHTALEPEKYGPPASNSYRLTPTADGHVAVMVVTPGQWAALQPALDLQLGGDSSDADRLREARRKIATMPSEAVVAALSSHQIPCAPVVSLDDISDQPQVQANGSVRVVQHPVLGPIRQVDPAPVLAGVDPGQLRPAPRVGEHSREVLAAHGYAETEIEAMVAAGVIGVPAQT